MQPDLTKLFSTQISLTEWFEAIHHPDAAKLRQEDNDKRERLGVLHKLISLPFDEPAQFSARAVADRTPAFQEYLKEHGDELCAVRVIPDNPRLPKLRMRGHTVREGTRWFDEQKVDPKHYRVDFVPHGETIWATIFIVNKRGVFGELTRGGHHELTQGLYDKHEPITFWYDFKTWNLSRDEPGAKAHLQDIVRHLHIADTSLQQKITAALSGTFVHDYLAGYFETTTSEDHGIWFIDYNRLLGDICAEVAPPKTSTGALVTGRGGSPGKASGTVRVILPEDVHAAKLKEGEVLVCSMTTPDYVPLMQQAAAIVTDLGGVLSHAAIIARELKKPCITGTKNATSLLKDGQRVIVDADAGTITPA